MIRRVSEYPSHIRKKRRPLASTYLVPSIQVVPPKKQPHHLGTYHPLAQSVEALSCSRSIDNILQPLASRLQKRASETRAPTCSMLGGCRCRSGSGSACNVDLLKEQRQCYAQNPSAIIHQLRPHAPTTHCVYVPNVLMRLLTRKIFIDYYLEVLSMQCLLYQLLHHARRLMYYR